MVAAQKPVPRCGIGGHFCPKDVSELYEENKVLEVERIGTAAIFVNSGPRILPWPRKSLSLDNTHFSQTVSKGFSWNAKLTGCRGHIVSTGPAIPCRIQGFYVPQMLFFRISIPFSPYWRF
jgi:hypothetical protein